jgi:hypothetical protein
MKNQDSRNDEVAVASEQPNELLELSQIFDAILRESSPIKTSTPPRVPCHAHRTIGKDQVVGWLSRAKEGNDTQEIRENRGVRQVITARL